MKGYAGQNYMFWVFNPTLDFALRKLLKMTENDTRFYEDPIITCFSWYSV